MKEDILEQIFEDWLLSKKHSFTKNNIKFKPDKASKEYDSRTDSSYSDIDILGIHLKNRGVKRVSVANCKSWQNGFDPKYWHDKLINHSDKKRANRENWKYFRELVNQKWSKAFREKIYEETQSKDFTYYLAVTKLIGKQSSHYKTIFENETVFIRNLSNNGKNKVEIKIITFEEIFIEYFHRTSGHTLEATMVGRLLQVMKASGIDLVRKKLKPTLQDLQSYDL